MEQCLLDLKFSFFMDYVPPVKFMEMRRSIYCTVYCTRYILPENGRLKVEKLSGLVALLGRAAIESGWSVNRLRDVLKMGTLKKEAGKGITIPSNDLQLIIIKMCQLVSMLVSIALMGTHFRKTKYT